MAPRHSSWHSPCGGEAGGGPTDQGAAHITRAEPGPVQRSRPDKYDRKMAQRSLIVGRGGKGIEARRRGEHRARPVFDRACDTTKRRNLLPCLARDLV